MSTLHICLFGKFQMRCGKQAFAALNARKVQELFCYLLLYRDCLHSREILANLLWDDCPTSESKRHLRQALWQLQTALDCQNEPINGPVLLVKPDWVQLNLDVNLWLDVAIFEQAFILVHGMHGRELDPQCFQILRSAADLYRGDLLEDCYQDWCLYERERFQNMYLMMLDKLTGYCEAHRDYETGLVYVMHILRKDRARERAHRRLMRLQYLAGYRTAALRQYDRCVATLAEELGVEPAKRTMMLYEQIRADQPPNLTSSPTEMDAAPEMVTASLPKVLGHLKHLQALLNDVQHQVEQEINVVEQVLNSQP